MRNLGSKAFVLVDRGDYRRWAWRTHFCRSQSRSIWWRSIAGTVRVTVDQEGKTRIHDKYVVSAPLSGRILRITMRPGDKVEAGKTLLNDDRAARSGAAR